MPTDRATRRVTFVWALGALSLVAAACGSSGTEASAPPDAGPGSDPPSSSPSDVWPFDDLDAASAPEDPDDEGDHGLGVPDGLNGPDGLNDDAEPVGSGDQFSSVELDGPRRGLISGDPVEKDDPCALASEADWADIRGIDADGVSQVPLESGQACGFVEPGDELRIAWSLFGMPTGRWLPDNVSTESVEVPGAVNAEWAMGYPMEVSSILEIWLPKASDEDIEQHLVVEISSRVEMEDAELRQLAVDFGALAAERALR